MWREILKQNIVSPTKTDILIIDAFNQMDDSEIIQLSINSFANKVGVMAGTITKFLYKYGFSGWKDFKVILAASFSTKKQSSVSIYQYQAHELGKFLSDNSEKNIFLLGHGMTSNICKMFSEGLRRCGFIAFNYDLSEDAMEYNSSNAIYIFVSVRGTSKKTLQEQRHATASNCKVVLVTASQKIINSGIKHNYFLDHKISDNRLASFLNGASEILSFFAKTIAWIENNRIIRKIKIKHV